MLERYGFQMVTQFPLDVMHLIDLGLGKLIIRAFFLNEIKELYFPTRPSTTSTQNKYVAQLAAAMSVRHEHFESFCPDLFARKPRPLNEYVDFKATELRQFLLYTGIVLIKENANPEAFAHFLCLSLGYRTLFSRNLSKDKLDTAAELLSLFVKDFNKFYNRNVSYNVHNLLHIVDCARMYGRVDGFSAYKYENSIRKLQFLIRNKTNVFSQIRNRLDERKNVGLIADVGKKIDMLDKKERNRFYRVEEVNEEGKTVYRYVRVEGVNGRICTVRSYERPGEYFQSPLSSLAFGIAVVEDTDLGETEELMLSDLIVTCYRLPTADNKFVLFPLVHTN